MSSAPVSWQQPKVWPPCCRAHFSSYFADKHGANHMIFIIHIYILNSPAFGTERLSIYLRLLRSFVLDIWQMVRCSRSCGFFDMAIRTMSDAILLWIFITVGDNAHTCHDFCVCFVLIILVNVEGYAVYCSILASRKSKLYTYIYANVWQICGIKLMWAKDYLLLCFFFTFYAQRK